MPWSPKQITMASFLKKNPDPSPPKKRKGNGNKRKLSISPNSANATSKKLNIVPTSSPNEDFPPLTAPLPVNPVPKPKPLTYGSSTNAPSLFRMDSRLLETETECDEFASPTSEEADALLKDDDPSLCDMGLSPNPSFIDCLDNAAESSPTAAVRSAIEAQINEGMSLEILQFDATLNTNKTNAIIDPKNIPLPITLPTTLPLARAPLPKPLPLFPDGLPYTKVHHKPKTAAKPANPLSNNANDAVAQDSTYAAKARTPPRARVLVEHILYVYGSVVAKRPLSPQDWELVDEELIGALATMDYLTTPVRIVNSGYDATHRCGFIACRDLASANWCKSAILGMGGNGMKTFRAWAKGEQPEVRLCRLFFPSRFDKIGEDAIVPLLIKHNPPFGSGTVVLKSVEDCQNGRAAFVEFDPISYAHVRTCKHRIEFIMQDIDCQVYVPRKAPKGPGIPGIQKLAQAKAQAPSNASDVTATPPAASSVTSSQSTSLKGSSNDPRLHKIAQPPLSFSNKPTQAYVESNNSKKRDRSAGPPAVNAEIKKSNTKSRA